MSIEISRLERQAALLETYRVGPGQPKFDLTEWGKSEAKRGGFLWLQTVECDTAACAVGLACLSNIFAADGLRYEKEDGLLRPLFRDKENWAAVRAFFGLSHRQAYRLFNSDSYANPAGRIAAVAVATRIRTMVRQSRAAQRPRKTMAAVEKIKARALATVE